MGDKKKPAPNLDQVIGFIHSGHKEAAQQALVAILRNEPYNETAWLWLADSFPTPAERIQALEQCLKVLPNSKRAKLALAGWKASATHGAGLQVSESPADAQQAAPAAQQSPAPVSESAEKTQPVRITRPAVVSAIDVSPTAAAQFPSKSQLIQSEEAEAKEPTENPRKFDRFWIILTVLTGMLIVGILGFVGWLWMQGKVEMPVSLNQPFSTAPIPTRQQSFNSDATQAVDFTQVAPPTPTRPPTLPAPLWDSNVLPVINRANASQLAQLATWEKPSMAKLSSNWQYLATSIGKDIQVWDVRRHARLYTLKGHTDTITALGFAPGQDILISGAQDQTIKVWDLTSGSLVKTLTFDPAELGRVSDSVPGAFSKAVHLKLSPGGKFLAASTYGLASVWDAKSWKAVHTFGLDRRGLETLYLEGPDTELDIALSPDEQSIAIHVVGKIMVNRIGNPMEQYNLQSPGALGIGFSGDGKQLIEAGNGYVTVRDATNGKEIATFKSLYNPAFAANTYAISPDGKLIALESRGEKDIVEVQVFEITTQQEIYSFPVFHQRLNTLQFSPDGKLLAAGGSERVAHIWDANTGTELLLLKNVDSLFISPDGREMAGSRDGNLNIFGVLASSPRVGLTPTPSPSSTPTY